MISDIKMECQKAGRSRRLEGKRSKSRREELIGIV